MIKFRGGGGERGVSGAGGGGGKGGVVGVGSLSKSITIL